MKQQKPSLMAEGIAIMRAIESDKLAGERICYDPYAKYFGGSILTFLSRFFLRIGYAERRGPGVEGFLVARTRYIDDYTQACIEDGIKQLVILGAGYDTRAYRLESLKERVKVFEVDHPATQKVKIEKIKKLFGTLPEHVVYIPIDFEQDTLEGRLYEGGYDRRLKTVFVWEGVTMYITAQAVDSTLGFVAHNSGEGSSIIFDYVLQSVVDGTFKRGEAASMRRYRRFTGEGFVFGIKDGAVEPFLEQRGFCQVKNATSGTLKALYFSGPNAKREVAPVYAIASAVVKPESDG